MKSAEWYASRRSAINDALLHRLVPSATMVRPLASAALHGQIDELNQPGRLPPGLHARPAHLIFRAIARALADQTHFGCLLLPGGAQFEPEQNVLRLPFGGPGTTTGCLVGDPGPEPLDAAVAGMEAAEVEGRVSAENDRGKAARDRRNHPLMTFLIHTLARKTLARVRDRVRMPPGLIRTAVEQTGNLAVFDLAPLGADCSGAPLTGARHAQFLIGPERHPDSPRAVLPLALSFDQRLFEAWEAAAFLEAVAGLLFSPEADLA